MTEVELDENFTEREQENRYEYKSDDHKDETHRFVIENEDQNGLIQNSPTRTVNSDLRRLEQQCGEESERLEYEEDEEVSEKLKDHKGIEKNLHINDNQLPIE